MAEWYDNQLSEYYDESGPPEDPSGMVHDLLYGAGYEVDLHAQQLFTEAVFEKSDEAYRDLIDYMWDEYGIDFEDAFSWEDFREWYGSQ